jgi:hypothetical protein
LGHAGQRELPEFSGYSDCRHLQRADLSHRPVAGAQSRGGRQNGPDPDTDPLLAVEGRINQVDVRLARKFQLARVRLQSMFDVYNLTNANPILAENTTYGQSWMMPTQILSGRLAKIGVQLNF